MNNKFLKISIIFTFVTTIFLSGSFVSAWGGGGDGGGGDCFIAGTQITMSDNSTKNIEDVRVGDRVKTVNIETMEIENKVVLDLLSEYHTGKEDDYTVRIVFSNGTINQNTNSHPYYTKEKGWASDRPDLTKEKYNLTVAQLEAGDTVYEIKNNKLNTLKITEINNIYKGVQTYNLSSVADNHNFFAEGILVHNKIGDGGIGGGIPGDGGTGGGTSGDGGVGGGTPGDGGIGGGRPGDGGIGPSPTSTPTPAPTPTPTPYPTPSCTLNISPSSIINGGSSTLTWTTSNATSMTINQSVGSVSISGGSRTISPTTTTTYTGTVTGAGGTATCTDSITVSPLPAPTCTMSASPTSILTGGSSTLTWTTTNVASASIDNSIGSVAVNSSTSVSPSSTTTYIGTFIGTDSSTINCSATVTVDGIPPAAPTCSMSFNPTAVFPGGSSTLTWTSTNTTSGTIDNSVGTVAVNDSILITPIGASTYTGTFIGPGGSVSCSASISVSSSGCVTNCGGGNNPPNVSLSRNGFPVVDPEPSYVYLSQVPYTGFITKIINGVKVIMVKVPEFIMAN